MPNTLAVWSFDLPDGTQPLGVNLNGTDVSELVESIEISAAPGRVPVATIRVKLADGFLQALVQNVAINASTEEPL